MSDVLNRVRRICVFALPARDCLQSGVSRRGGVRRSAVSSVVSRSVVTALVVGAVWGCGNDGGDSPSGPGSSLGPGASNGVVPNDTAQGNVAPVSPGSNGTGSTDTGANGTGSNSTGANNTAPNGTGANGSTDTGSNSEPNSSNPTGATGGVAPVTPAGSTGDDGVTGPPNDVSPMPSNTAGTEPGGGDQTTTPTSDTDTVGNTGEQTDSTEVDTTNDTTDAQTTDEPSPGTADCGSLLLCDDFEGVAAGDAPNDELWSLPMGRPANAVVVSAEQQRSGNQSVKVTYGSDNGGAPSMFYNTSIFPLPGNVVHFRAWVRFESSWENHITFAAVGPLPIEEWGDEIRFGGQHGIYYVNQAPSDSFSPNPWECTDCIAPTPETWTCLRGMFDFDQLQATLHVGDSIAVDLARDGWRNNEQISFPANPERFGLGFIDHNGSGPITAYFDDVALGYEPIPCE